MRLDDRLCLLVIIGSDENGRKELVALSDGYRESAASWEEVLTDLRQRGLKTAPKLAIGDGALGFWKAVGKLWPETDQQRCWVHKTANVLEKLPKAMQPKVKEALHAIWQAETREQAYKAFDHCIERFEPEYPKAMAFKLMETAQKKWLRLRGYKQGSRPGWSIAETQQIRRMKAGVTGLTNKIRWCERNARSHHLTNKVRLCEQSEPQSEPVVGQVRWSQNWLYMD